MACLDLDGRRCLVVGGGAVGAREGAGLLDCGARVTVVAPELDDELRASSTSSGAQRRYETGDLDGMFLVVAATVGPRRQPARARATPRRARCSATSPTCPSSATSSCPPSTARARSPSPSRPAAPRRRSRSGCATRSPSSSAPEHAELAERAARAAARVKERFPTYEERRDYFEALVRGGARVTVYLVGAGPGDPGLITARGLELVRACDVLVYDVLVAPELVAEAPEDALLISRERARAGRDQRPARRPRPRAASTSCASRAATRSSSAAAARRRSRSPRRASRSRSSRASRRSRPCPRRPGSRSPTAASPRRSRSSSGHSAYGDDLDYAPLAATPGTLVSSWASARSSGSRRGLIAHGKSPRHAGRGRLARHAAPTAHRSSATLARDRPARGKASSRRRSLVVGDVVGVASELEAAGLCSPRRPDASQLRSPISRAPRPW